MEIYMSLSGSKVIRGNAYWLLRLTALNNSLDFPIFKRRV